MKEKNWIMNVLKFLRLPLLGEDDTTMMIQNIYFTLRFEKNVLATVAVQE